MDGQPQRALQERLRAWGVDPRYEDHRGRWQEPPRETLVQILEAMGAEGAPPSPRARVVRSGQTVSWPATTTLVLEDGTALGAAEIPPELPLGYHSVIDEGAGETIPLIVVPARCHLPGDLRTWGWAVQAYALRTRTSWGIGDLGGVRRLAVGSSEMGAGMLLLGPLHATRPGTPQEPSPYYPASRCFMNPLYLALEEVPGFAEISERDELLATARSLNGGDRIDHDAVYATKMRGLEACWRVRGGGRALKDFVSERGRTLELFATFVALAERYGSDWRTWPEGLRHPDGSEVARFRRSAQDRVMFHCWLQQLLDDQLRRASESLALVHDLAIGVDPNGADAWIWQDVFAPNISVGAPVDEYNTRGQDWGAAAFDPWRLQDAAFDPFVRMVRAALRHAGGMRFDHVMGLFRLFWIPPGAEPAAGAYVRYPAQELLGILALESRRSGAYVVGEDLGTVEPVVREEMARRDMLSYKLLWFEEGPPEDYPRLSLAAGTSHDLPTTKGLWTGSDLAFQKRQSLDANEAFTVHLMERLADLTGCPRSAAARAVIERSQELLARSGSAVAAASLEDALEMEDRHNYPGTSGPWNWSLLLPAAVEDVLEDERVKRVGRTMSRYRNGAVAR